MCVPFSAHLTYCGLSTTATTLMPENAAVSWCIVRWWAWRKWLKVSSEPVPSFGGPPRSALGERVNVPALCRVVGEQVTTDNTIHEKRDNRPRRTARKGERASTAKSKLNVLAVVQPLAPGESRDHARRWVLPCGCREGCANLQAPVDQETHWCRRCMSGG